MNPIVKTALTILAGLLVASPTVPALLPYSPVLSAIGGIIGGWLHLPQPKAAQ